MSERVLHPMGWFGLKGTFKVQVQLLCHKQGHHPLDDGESTTSLGNLHPGDRKAGDWDNVTCLDLQSKNSSFDLPALLPAKFSLLVFGKHWKKACPWQQGCSCRPLLVVGSESCPVTVLMRAMWCPLLSPPGPIKPKGGNRAGDWYFKNLCSGRIFATARPVQNELAHTVWFCWLFSSRPDTKSDYKEK